MTSLSEFNRFQNPVKEKLIPEKEEIKKVINYLTDLGFEEQTSDMWGNHVFMYRKDMYRYGRYTCRVKMNAHRITDILHHFSGDSTGIEGWSSYAFSGSIESLEDLKKIFELTFITRKIKEAEEWQNP